MGLHVVRLPDVGEGIAEAELVEWRVAVGDRVEPDAHLADVLTDKATIEISSPVAGVVTFLGGEPGDLLAIGSDFVGIEVDGAGNAAGQRRTSSSPDPVQVHPVSAEPAPAGTAPGSASPQTPEFDQSGHSELAEPAHLPSAKPIAAPAVRLRAKDLGVDLPQVAGSGPAGRITHGDLDRFVAGDAAPMRRAAAAPGATTDTRIVGLRRKIAEQMSRSASRIPHITYVDEVDMTAVESLRSTLNDGTRTKLTVLPFVIRAVVRAIGEQPQLNATFDDEAGVLTTFADVHVGIATQTPNGLVVPVVRNAGLLGLWSSAAEIARVSEAARTGTASRDELGGSTITITSLGALGGLVTTPIINHPEVAIIGINKIQVRPVWEHDRFVPRTMMNLSSSFDHRIVDGFDAAIFVQRIKALLETPALLFIDTEDPDTEADTKADTKADAVDRAGRGEVPNSRAAR